MGEWINNWLDVYFMKIFLWIQYFLYIFFQGPAHVSNDQTLIGLQKQKKWSGFPHLEKATNNFPWVKKPFVRYNTANFNDWPWAWLIVM